MDGSLLVPPWNNQQEFHRLPQRKNVVLLPMQTTSRRSDDHTVLMPAPWELQETKSVL